MGMVSLNCPNCGASMDVDESREFCFCQFCGTKVMHEKIIVEHKGEVSVEGVAKYEDLLTLGNDYFEASDYDNAKNMFSRCLELNPTEYNIHYKLLFCKYNINSLNFESILSSFEPNNPFIDINTSTTIYENKLKELEDSTEFKNCLKYASPLQRDKLLNSIKLNKEKTKINLQKKQETEKAENKGCLTEIIICIILSVVVGFITYSASGYDGAITICAVVFTFSVSALITRKIWIDKFRK